MRLKDFLEQSPELFTDLPITGKPLEILLPVIQNLDEFKNCQIELINTKDNGKDNLLIFTKHKNNLYIIIGRIPQKQVHKHIL